MIRPKTRGGFTLVEVLVALAVGGLVILLAHRLFAAAGDASRAVTIAQIDLDRDANARRWLQAAFLSLDVGTDSGTSFEGRPDRVTFSSWLQTSDQWTERRRVELSAADARFLAKVGGESVILTPVVESVAFDYLLEPGADSKWVREWVSPVSAPLAVRVRVHREPAAGSRAPVDTVLFLIKERG
jgi:prepilin-type N-terminal cleavage/methylation domain-containing protein